MISNFSKTKLKIGSKLFCLLLIFFVFSCKNETSNKIYTEKQEITEKQDDSIFINIKFKSKGLVVLQTSNDVFYSEKIEFSNRFSNDTILKIRVKKQKGYQIYEHGYFLRKNNISNLIRQYFLITPETQSMNLEYFEMNLYDRNSYYSSELIDIYKSYDTIKLGISKNKDSIGLTKKLEDLYSALDKKYSVHKEKKITQLNKTLYISLLQGINNKNPKIKRYIKNMDDPILGGPFQGLMFNYIKYNFKKIDFEDLSPEKSKEKEIDYIAASLFNFLKYDNNYKRRDFESSIKWLKTTKFYEEDSIFIKKEITPLNNSMFKKIVSDLSFVDVNNNKNSISEIIKKYPSKFYLIDFWATWCAPCISGVKLMNEMKFPRNIKIISISLDKEKDTLKWKLKTKELRQSYTFWLDDNSLSGKTFLNFIELQSIPRYILIDKNLNLIDQSFLNPHEIDFLPKLRDIENYKFW